MLSVNARVRQETDSRRTQITQEFTKQGDAANRIYTEPRCHEGNFGLVGILVGGRADDRAFAEGRGPDPATMGGGGPVPRFRRSAENVCSDLDHLDQLLDSGR